MFCCILLSMDHRFDDKNLARMAADPSVTGGFDQSVARSFRKLMSFIRAARDERDFYSMKSLHYEKMRERGRDGQHSMRLNLQWRLILKFEETESGKLVVVVSIEDYH